MIIRKANSSDIDEIVRIESEWKDEYPCWGKNGFLREFEKENSITFIAIIEGVVCGFINIWITDVVEINSVVVSKSYLKKGVASNLIKRVSEEALSRGIERIVLEVREDNIAALNLYKRSGFEVYNLRKKYYDFKYDAIMMRKVVRRI